MHDIVEGLLFENEGRHKSNGSGFKCNIFFKWTYLAASQTRCQAYLIDNQAHTLQPQNTTSTPINGKSYF
jgi:hypothetical protein